MISHYKILNICTLFIIFSFFSKSSLKAQNDLRIDSLIKQKHSPTLASAMSAIVPGSGQVYNKKYWKFPVIYAGMGTLTYLVVDYNKEYQKYKTAYKYITDNDPDTFTPYQEVLTSDEIENEMNRWRRFRDLNGILLFGVYILNIIDASVDAHLYNYDVSDDLSLKLDPVIYHNNKTPIVGVKLCLNLK